MTELVLDPSAYVQVVGSKRPEHADLRARIVAAECHAPHLLDAEVGHVLRRRVLAGVLTAALDVPLLIADGRLARAPGLPCQMELVG